MRHVNRHARSARRTGSWGSSIAALGAALLVVGLTSPASSADATPEDPAAVEQSTATADAQSVDQADATSGQDQAATEEQQGNDDLPATATAAAADEADAEQSSSDDAAEAEAADASAEAAEESVLSTLSVAVTDEAGAAVPGVGFELWLESNGSTGLQRSGDTVVDADCTTAGDGTCTAGADASGAAELEAGTYYWVQTETPDGYQTPEDGDEPAGTATITEDEAGTDLNPTEVTLVAVEDDEAAEEEATDEVASADEDAAGEADRPATLSSEDGAMAPMSVPNPSSNAGTAVINVNVGGLRTGASSVGGLEGVTLRLHTGGSGGPGNPVNEDWAECVSDSDGDCSFTVPETQPEQTHWDWSCGWLGCWVVTQHEGDNYDTRFWVVQESTPSGWNANDELVVGTATNNYASDYVFRTGDRLRAGQTYQSGSQFMANSGNQTSTGIWQNSIANPQLPQTCSDGLNVALILDRSGSVGNAGAMGDLKDSAKSFVDALVGTNSSVALYSFSDGASREMALTPVDGNVNAFHSVINGYQSRGGTNWDQGIWRVANDNASYDLAIVVTDGLPTFYGPNAAGPGNNTRFMEAEQAIFSANALKNQGTRLLAVGVGDGISGSPANLAAVSGPNGYTGGSANNADYFQASWSALQPLLSSIAKGATCQATIDVTKYTQTYGSSSWEETPGWAFDAAQQTGPETFASIGDGTTGSDGTVEFTVQFDSMTATTTVRLTEVPSEAQQDLGWELVADRVQCTVNNSPVDVDVNASGLSLTIADVGVNDHVSCDFYNRQVLTPDIEVVKQGWDAQDNEVVSGSSMVSGTVITWTYEVTNTGETTLHDIAVVDDQVGTATCPQTSLPAGESMTCTASGPVTALP